MAPKRTKGLARDVSLAQVPELPNLYYVSSRITNASKWEQTWRHIPSFRSEDYGVIIAGKNSLTVDNATERDWCYVSREDPPEDSICWSDQFTETETEDPYVYANLNRLCRDVVLVNGLPTTVRFEPMFWIRSEEGWRVPHNKIRAHGIRNYTAAELEESRRRSEHRR
jgi:hypothetical protein